MHTIKKCSDPGGGIHMVLLQITTTPLGQGLPSPTTLLFNHPVCGIIPVIGKNLISVDHDD